MDQFILILDGLIEVLLNFLEDRIIFNVVVVLVERCQLQFDFLLLLLQIVKSFRTNMRIIISSQHFLDLIEQLQGNSLTMISIRTLYLLKNPKLGCDLVDIMLLMLIDGLVIIYLAGLFILNNIIFSLQPLELIGNLQLQGRVSSKVIQQLVEISQLLILRPCFPLDLVKVVFNLYIRSIILLRFIVLLQILQIPQSSFIETQLETQSQLAKTIILRPIQLLRNQNSQGPHFLLYRGVDPHQILLKLAQLVNLPPTQRFILRFLRQFLLNIYIQSSLPAISSLSNLISSESDSSLVIFLFNLFNISSCEPKGNLSLSTN